MTSFETIDTDEYIRYIEKAELLQEKGLHTDKTVIQLAKLIYENDLKNGSGG
jgi:hypothetical protein